MFVKKLALPFLSCLALIATPVNAHFQLVYTPEVNLQRAGDVPVKLIFWHPFDNGHAMDMGPLEAFYVHHRGEKTDLTERVKPVTFKGASNEASAYEATVPVKRNGDYILVAVPSPYFEASEDIYIQQITKSFLNKGTVPTDWDQELGLPTEIVPLNRPTNIIAGSTFTGRVLSQGKPVAGAEIEIEYMAAEPDMETNTAGTPTVSPMNGGTISARSDETGMFTFGIPKAGFWGFAALGAGPDTEHEGKELSQDAVLWIKAEDMQ